MDPLSIILAILMGAGTLLGSGDDEQKQTTTIPRRGYQSPFLGMMDAQGAEMLSRMQGLYSTAGFPTGSTGWGSSSLIGEGGILEALKMAMPEIIGNVAAPAPDAESLVPFLTNPASIKTALDERRKKKAASKDSKSSKPKVKSVSAYGKPPLRG